MKYILYIAKFYSIPIFKPLVSFLENSKDEYRFYVSQKVKDNFPEEWNKSLLLNDLKSAKIFKADFVLSPGNYVDFRIPGTKVQIFHGIGIEKPAHYKIRHFYDVYLTSGPFVTKKFLKLKKKNKDYFEVKETGWVKIDYILNYPKESLKEKYNIPEDQKIVLYAPTFSNTMESGSKMSSEIENLIKDDEFWILKFHEFMDKETVEYFKSKKNENLQVLETFDITPFLHIADVMISDTSSVVYEFMALKKPVITINTISRKDKGIDVQKISDIRQKLDLLFENPHLLDENIKKHLSEVNPYLDGKIAERIFLTLSEIEEKFSFPRKNKPLNLKRKLEIIYHSIFRKGYLK